MPDDLVLHPVEQARRVRVAAIAAGERAGWTVPAGLLDRIVAETANLRQSQAELERVAVGLVERARNDERNGTAPRNWDATNADANRYFRVIWGQVVYGQEGLPPALAARGGEGSVGYGALANTDLTSTAEMSNALEHADRCGLGWLRRNRDLLQLGPGAIRTLVEARFREETFRRMTEVRFSARDIVGLADYANRHNLDANQMGQVSADTVRVLGGGNPDEERRWRELIANLGRHRDNPAAETAARHQLIDALNQHRQQNPQHAPQVDRQLDALRLRDEARLRANNRESNADVQAATVSQNNDVLTAMLAAPAPAQPAAPPQMVSVPPHP